MVLLLNLKSHLVKLFSKEKCCTYIETKLYSSTKTYKLLFFGSDEIALSSLRKISEFRKKENHLIDRLDLVTTDSKHKTNIIKYAQTEGIQTIKWPLQNLKAAEYDLGLIVAFGHLIKEDLLNKFPLGMVNVHPSLLPRWRGAAPIIHTLLHGDTITGVTLMKIKADIFDVGEIISQVKVPVSKDIKLPELTEELSGIGADMLVDCIQTLPMSLINTQPQSSEGVTYGEIISQVKVPVSKDIKLPELTEELSGIGADMLVDCIQTLPMSLINTVVGAEKFSNGDHAPVDEAWDGPLRDTAKKINKSISEVRWTQMTAAEVYNLYRAIYGLFPLTTKFENKQMKLFDAFIHNPEEVETKNKLVGTVEYCDETKAIRILCKDLRYIYFRSLRIVGKRQISALDFYNGYIKNVPLEKREFTVFRNQ